MDETTRFSGFPPAALRFLEELGEHNTTSWFQAHRAEYEEAVMAPSRAFVVAMGKRLKTIAKEIQADPRVNGSLFRINRDTRFSADKTPYKTSVGIFFWEGAGQRMELPGFYFHLEPGKLMLGTGIYLFPRPMLERYRAAVIDPKLGPALAKAVKAVGEDHCGTGCGMPIETYKKVPPGYDPEHPRAELLKNKGLVAGYPEAPPKALHSADLVEHCLERYRQLAPLHRWLVKMLSESR